MSAAKGACAPIAALASLNPEHVRLLARRGEFTLENGTFAAKRWLSGRGIKGLTQA